MDKEQFIERLTQLRINKGVSARDMSLSLGQSAGYINNIENGVNLPSMNIFFYICEYLNISPREFFDFDNRNPVKCHELLEAAKPLSSEQLELLISIAKMFQK
jgi:transcriptional regulator with XRE-family HTH domain